MLGSPKLRRRNKKKLFTLSPQLQELPSPNNSAANIVLTLSPKQIKLRHPHESTLNQKQQVYERDSLTLPELSIRSSIVGRQSNDT